MPDIADQKSSRSGSKIDSIIAMLRHTEGTSLAEMSSATGGLPHTTRAALTGLRKKGHAIDKQPVDGTTRYFLSAPSGDANA